MKNYLLLFFALGVCCFSGHSQKVLSLEFQAYPTGIIPGVSLDLATSSSEFIYIRLGYNAFDHRDLGVHHSEKGGGFGGSLGYKKILGDKRSWILGLKTDLWWNHVDWMDDNPSTTTTGKTDILVLQPTVEMGYLLRKGGLIFTPTVAFGMEWNVITEGSETGQGPIILVGFQLGRSF